MRFLYVLTFVPKILVSLISLLYLGSLLSLQKLFVIVLFILEISQM